jgi:cytochrome bd-I ubiquinol oxidase subunit X
MWYFSWILGTGLALSFAVLNAIWYEIMDQLPEQPAQEQAVFPFDKK